jgi:hypothetical protein
MGKRSILGSLFSAIFLAAIVFFVLFFFVPTISQTFFNVSYQGLRDTTQLKNVLSDTLEGARVPQIAIDEYLSRIDESDFYQTVQKKSQEGEEALLSYLAEIGDGIDFGELKADQLKNTFKDGFAQAQKFSSGQLSALKRLLSQSLDNL